jgi:UDP-N-acetylglucosamine 2-epimerase
MRVMTIVGTRPEIIRLACVIKKLDEHCEQIFIHTGQNYDYELSQVFFEDLDLRAPDEILSVRADTLHEQLGNIITQTGAAIKKYKPDALLVLGDTNSALSVINAKREKIPIYHLEAGDRSFDQNVPEELNRRIVDHTADINIAYTEYSRRNLLREGIHPSKIFVTGSPIREVYDSIKDKFATSNILADLKLKKGKYIAASVHREENVDIDAGIHSLVECYNALVQKFDMPVVVSTHPRTRVRLEATGLMEKSDPRVIWHKPFGLIDYVALQLNAACVVSDSGTIHEDSSILNFPAVAIRKSTEKAESIDAGHCVITGLNPESVIRSVEILMSDPVDLERSPIPAEYMPLNVSGKVVRMILGMNDVVRERVWGPSPVI